MFIHNYTVKLCKQVLNTTKSAKDTPYFYYPTKLSVDELKELTQDELDHIYKGAQEITSLIESETFRRLENDPSSKAEGSNTGTP